MKQYLIIYHCEDNDGVCSAAIIKNYLINTLSVDPADIELLSGTYNGLAKIVTNEDYLDWPNQYAHIIITDISFDEKMMVWITKTYGDKFTWFDHHLPIIKASVANNFDHVNGIRDTNHSAIWNVYKYLYDPFMEREFPYVVDMLSSWDSWSYVREGKNQDTVRTFNTGFTITSELKVKWYMKNIDWVLCEEDPSEDEFSKFINDIMDTGKREIDRQDKANEELIRVSGDKTWTVNGIPAIMVCTSGATNSLMFKSLQVKNVTESDIRVAAVFKHCNSGEWVLSLYNIYDYAGDKTNKFYFHGGEYLKLKYNGGGHEGAAGCTISIDRFYLMLKSKKI